MILDTNALSALANTESSLQELLGDPAEQHLPAIVLGEYRFGLLNSRHRHELEVWLEHIESLCFVLMIDSITARHYATIRQELRRMGKPIPENDIWIAALARQHHLPVVSQDEHFDLVPGLRRRGW